MSETFEYNTIVRSNRRIYVPKQFKTGKAVKVIITLLEEKEDKDNVS